LRPNSTRRAPPLEAFAEQTRGPRRCSHRFAAHIHLARRAPCGSLEIYGGALLAEEMEAVARYVDVHSRRRPRRCRRPRRADAGDGAVAGVSSSGSRPVRATSRSVLLPLLNDLRAVRGSGAAVGRARC
jgi:hypothetical protein